MSDQPEALRLADALEGRCGPLLPILPAAAELRRLHAEIESLKEELETERVRLAACGVIAMANTTETAAKFREMNLEYRSASCDDVAKAVDREMALRAECDALRKENERLRHSEQGFADAIRAATTTIDNHVIELTRLHAERDALKKTIRQQDAEREFFSSKCDALRADAEKAKFELVEQVRCFREEAAGEQVVFDTIVAERDALRAALRAMVEVQDEACRLDHHGYCQAHYLDHGMDGCRVAAARAALKEAK